MIHLTWNVIFVALLTGIPFILIVLAFRLKLRKYRKADETCCHKEELEGKIDHIRRLSDHFPIKKKSQPPPTTNRAEVH